uniref:Uncharacterized protein n=1 Tax=Anguilla anguilla TaxID=7936 RepID=A0A0E9WAG0_ANGAN
MLNPYQICHNGWLLNGGVGWTKCRQRNVTLVLGRTEPANDTEILS